MRRGGEILKIEKKKKKEKQAKNEPNNFADRISGQIDARLNVTVVPLDPLTFISQPLLCSFPTPFHPVTTFEHWATKIPKNRSNVSFVNWPNE